MTYVPRHRAGDPVDEHDHDDDEPIERRLSVVRDDDERWPDAQRVAIAALVFLGVVVLLVWLLTAVT